MMNPRCVLQLVAWFGLLVVGLVVVVQGGRSRLDAQAPVKAEPSLKDLLTRLKPLEPTAALKTFRVEKGFRLELVACEPDVVSPVALAFDADGRLYVAEDIDYPFPPEKGKKPLSRVRLLTDPDEQGRYRRSTVFADGVQWASGIACWQGGVFVAAPPQILYLKDTNGDGQADVRRVVYDGFGTHSAEDIMNNLQWGLDNRIYGAASYNGGDVRPAADPRAVGTSVRNSSFRFDPVTGKFEVIPGTGDFGNCFDDCGNRFVANAGTLLIHPVFPGTYLARNPYLTVSSVLHNAAAGKKLMAQISPPEPWRVVRKQFWERWVNSTPEMRAARFSQAELAERGFVTGGAGCCIYRGTAFPEEFRGNSFTAEPAGNLVVRLKVEPDGVTFRATAVVEDREFLASTDNWFRPVNVANGPDGCLYVCDMYREVIEDPSAIPDDILKIIDVTNGRNRGRIYRIVPEGQRRPEAPALSKASTAELVGKLEHPDSWWRETAQRLLFERQDKTAAELLRKLAVTARLPQTRLHALWSLHGLQALDDATLRQALDDPHPAVREHAIRLAEGRLASKDLRQRVITLAGDAEPRLRFQAALTLGEIADDDAALTALARVLTRDAADRWIPHAVLSSVAAREAALFRMLLQDQRFSDSPAAATCLSQLAALAAARRRPADMAVVLRAVAQPPLADRPEWQRGILLGLADALARAGGSLQEVLADGELKPAAGLFAQLLAEAGKTAADDQQPLAERVSAVRLLRHGRAEAVRQPLAELLVASQPPEVQLAAIQSLGAQRGEAVARLLLDRWPGVSPRCHNEMLEAIFREEARLPLLLDAVGKKVVPLADLGPERRQRLLKHPMAAIRERAERLIGNQATPSRKAVLDRYQEALKLAGDPLRGEKVFAKTCAACHRFGKEGRSVGPDLNSIQNRAPDALLVAILDPNREVPSNYISYTLATKDGRVLTGILAAETAASVTLRRAEGAEDIVLRSQIEELTPSGQSLMPEGLEQQIDIQQTADLLRYLSRQGGP
ncbi:MAG: HEAT repeat domain-containing protein [Planctomycetia bacterium]|nr:HEAT repeat domain-containing protein [Planctomycetia bacterium]